MVLKLFKESIFFFVILFILDHLIQYFLYIKISVLNYCFDYSETNKSRNFSRKTVNYKIALQSYILFKIFFFGNFHHLSSKAPFGMPTFISRMQSSTQYTKRFLFIANKVYLLSVYTQRGVRTRNLYGYQLKIYPLGYRCSFFPENYNQKT